MKLAVSNIAWDIDENDDIVCLLNQKNVKGIEIAPTKRWVEPAAATEIEIEQYLEFWRRQGLLPVAMQSLLFGKPNMSIFGEEALNTKDYLKKIIHLAGRLSIKSVVFGSPKNRLIGENDRELYYEQAIDFFTDLAKFAADNGVSFCIEPNPKEYGCDFITTSMEALQIVKHVGHSGFRVHLDTGTMLINGEDPEHTLRECLPYTAHFHVSDPNLMVPGSYMGGHGKIALALKQMNYNGWISIEMKSGLSINNYETLNQALIYVVNTYFSNDGGTIS